MTRNRGWSEDSSARRINSIDNYILHIFNDSSINGMLEHDTFIQIDRFLILHGEIFNLYITSASCAAALTVANYSREFMIQFQIALLSSTRSIDDLSTAIINLLATINIAMRITRDDSCVRKFKFLKKSFKNHFISFFFRALRIRWRYSRISLGLN